MKWLLAVAVAAATCGRLGGAVQVHSTFPDFEAELKRADKVDKEFQAADADGDGVIDEDEFAAMHEDPREERAAEEAEGHAVVKFANHKSSRQRARARVREEEQEEEEAQRSYDSLSAPAPSEELSEASLLEEQQAQAEAVQRLQREVGSLEEAVDGVDQDVQNLSALVNETKEVVAQRSHWSHVDGSPVTWLQWLFHWIIAFLVFAFPTLVFACIYRTFGPKKGAEYLETSGRWHNSLFDCFSNLGEDWPLCLMACFCPSIRWADTVSNKRHFAMMDFWPALLLFLLLGIFLAPVTASLSVALLFCYCVYLRRQMRAVYGFEMGGATLVYDMLSWGCCPCCTILQEARQVERVEPLAKYIMNLP